jgi:hypothetical protein
MDESRIFSAEQIEVPPDLAKIIREYTKAVVRTNPNDILAFSQEYFASKMAQDEDRRKAELAAGGAATAAAEEDA